MMKIAKNIARVERERERERERARLSKNRL